jgi:hypothetical protein
VSDTFTVTGEWGAAWERQRPLLSKLPNRWVSKQRLHGDGGVASDADGPLAPASPGVRPSAGVSPVKMMRMRVSVLRRYHASQVDGILG